MRVRCAHPFECVQQLVFHILLGQAVQQVGFSLLPDMLLVLRKVCWREESVKREVAEAQLSTGCVSEAYLL